MLKLDWGESQVWMKTAVDLYNKKHAMLDEHAQTIRHRYPKENELNVAYVCAGFAFELIFKVLVQLSGKAPKAKHEPSIAWNDICGKYCIEVRNIVTRNSWDDVDSFLQYLDEHLCHKDRKYWMRPPKGGKASGAFSLGGRRGINALSQLHEEISNFVLDAIDRDHNVHELWDVRNDVPN